MSFPSATLPACHRDPSALLLRKTRVGTGY